MKKIAAALLMFAAGSIALAQDKSNQLSPYVRIYEPKQMTASRANQVAQFVTTVLGGSSIVESTLTRSTEGPGMKIRSGIQVYWDDIPHAVVIRGGTPADQDAAEALLKRFDVPDTKPPVESIPPASRFEITAYLIRADAGTTSSQRSSELMPVPKDLQSAIDEMKQTFSYHDYRLWDAIVTQPGGQVDLSGILPGRPGVVPDTYSLTFQRSRVSDDKTINLDGFEFLLKEMATYGKEPLTSRISHTVTLHTGQKLVLGKIRLLPEENADLFLILTAKLK